MITVAVAQTTLAHLRHFVTRQLTRVELPSEWSVEHATREIARAIELPEADLSTGGQLYELFRRRGGETERLAPSARIAEVVREGDELEAMPEVVPGAPRV